jgi:hypothetical protein
MNRARLAQLLSAVAVVGVGTLTFTIYAPDPGVTALDLLDAGVAANLVATCPVRVAPACSAAFGVGCYETVRFPVYFGVLHDAGREVVLPPRFASIAVDGEPCLHVMDWDRCDLDTVAAYPAIAAKWDDAVPAVKVRSASRFVIPDCRGSDGGWVDDVGQDGGPVPDCRARELDGGSRWAGCNVLERPNSVGSQCLDAPGGGVRAGEQMEFLP